MPNLISLYILDINTFNSDELIKKCIRDFCNMPLEDLYILRNQNKKPVAINANNVYFSVSHSKNIWGCAISNCEIGLDIQYNEKKFNKNISKRFFNNQEYLYLENNNYIDFYDVWSAKESYSKYTGNGLFGGLFSDFSVIEKSKFKKQVNDAFIIKLDVLKKYSTFISSPIKSEIKIIYK